MYHLYTELGRGERGEEIEIPPGHTLVSETGARFELKYPVRGGGNGLVFKGLQYDPAGKFVGDCAVKLLKQLSVGRIQRFENETRILRRLDHRNIAKFFGKGSVSLKVASAHGGPQGRAETRSIPWAAMELGGKNLRERITISGAMNPAALVAAGIQACDALQAIHDQFVIHRDVKPDNFVEHTSRESGILMIDFGIAKLTGEVRDGRVLETPTLEREFVGPALWASPELIAYARDKSHPVDQRSDLFQFGKVLWFLATGVVLTGIPSTRRDPTGGRLHALVSALLSESPEDRPSAAGIVRKELERM